MKKNLLLFVFALVVSALYAQNGEMHSFFFHTMDWDDFEIESVAQQRDGNIIVDTYIGMNGSNPYEPPILLGNVFYKMSPTSLSITDSLYLADSLAPEYFYSQDPRGEGNIRVNIEYEEEVDSTYIRICHFHDNDFHINHDEDVVAPLCEGYATGGVSLVDCWGDLILQYYRIDGLYFDIYAARFGIDGTLKHQALVHEHEMIGVGRLKMLNESPLKYYQLGPAGTYNSSWENLAVYVLDSLFHKNPIIISSLLNSTNEYLYAYNDTEIISIEEDNVLVAARYVYEPNHNNPMENEFGVVVAKYDLRTMQPKGHIVFNDYPGVYRTGQCLGTQYMRDGTVYFLYKEEGYPEESFVAVKMDTDLNVEWKRFFKTDNIKITWLPFHILSDDEQGEEKGIIWIGRGTNIETNKDGLVYLFLNHEGPVNWVNETGIEMRPYVFYPNPVKEQLLLQFSPDVQPARVELYDLQVRLVRSQSKAFENIDMSQLPAGTYTLRVSLEDGKTYSDKVVKE